MVRASHEPSENRFAIFHLKEFTILKKAITLFFELFIDEFH
jgi:hypothetical protein